MTTIIELKNIDKTYTGAVDAHVLFDINLNFETSSCNAIIGESGSGKSTLLNIIGTLDKPTRGDVIIDGIRTTDMDKNELADLRNQTIGFVFQFHYLLPEFTALENVLMPYLIKNNRTSQEIMAKADEQLPLVGTHFHANIFWMGKAPMIKQKSYKLKIGAARVVVKLVSIKNVLDASDLNSINNKQLVDRHDVAQVILETSKPIAFDRVQDIEQNGRFVIVDNYEWYESRKPKSIP